MALVGYLTGSWSCTKSDQMKNLLLKKLAPVVIDAIDFDTTPVCALFWNLIWTRLPDDILGNFDSFLKKTGIVQQVAIQLLQIPLGWTSMPLEQDLILASTTKVQSLPPHCSLWFQLFQVSQWLYCLTVHETSSIQVNALAVTSASGSTIAVNTSPSTGFIPGLSTCSSIVAAGSNSKCPHFEISSNVTYISFPFPPSLYSPPLAPLQISQGASKCRQQNPATINGKCSNVVAINAFNNSI